MQPHSTLHLRVSASLGAVGDIPPKKQRRQKRFQSVDCWRPRKVRLHFWRRPPRLSSAFGTPFEGVK